MRSFGRALSKSDVNTDEYAACKYWSMHHLLQYQDSTINVNQDTHIDNEKNNNNNIKNNKQPLSNVSSNITHSKLFHNKRNRSQTTQNNNSYVSQLLDVCQLYHFITQLRNVTGEIPGSLYYRRFSWIMLISTLLEANALKLAFQIILEAKKDINLPSEDPFLRHSISKQEEMLRKRLQQMHGSIKNDCVYYDDDDRLLKAKRSTHDDSYSSNDETPKRNKRTKSLIMSTSGHDTTPQRAMVEMNLVPTLTIQAQRCPPTVKTLKVRRDRCLGMSKEMYDAFDVFTTNYDIVEQPVPTNNDDEEENETMNPINSSTTLDSNSLNFRVGRNRVYYWCYDGLPGIVERVASETLLRFTNIQDLKEHCKPEQYEIDRLKLSVTFKPSSSSSKNGRTTTAENDSSTISSLFPVINHDGPDGGISACYTPVNDAVVGNPKLLCQELPIFRNVTSVPNLNSVGTLMNQNIWVKEEGGVFTSPASFHMNKTSSMISSYLSSCIRVSHSENSLWNLLYSILIIYSDNTLHDKYASSKNPWFTTMEPLPINHSSSSFSLNTKDRIKTHYQIAQDLQYLSGCQLAQRIKEIFPSVYGTRFSMSSWDDYSLEDLMDIVHAAGGRYLSILLSHMASDMGYLFFGLPDLVVWDSLPCTGTENCLYHKEHIMAKNKLPPAHIFVMEVKSEKDSIRIHQYEWLQYLLVNNFPTGVIHVRRESNIVKLSNTNNKNTKPKAKAPGTTRGRKLTYVNLTEYGKNTN